MNRDHILNEKRILGYESIIQRYVCVWFGINSMLGDFLKIFLRSMWVRTKHTKKQLMLICGDSHCLMEEMLFDGGGDIQG